LSIVFGKSDSLLDVCKVRGKGKGIPVQACYRPIRFQEAEAPRSLENPHIKVARLSAYAPAAFTPRIYPWYSFFL
jgi:hypothetical protein